MRQGLTSVLIPVKLFARLLETFLCRNDRLLVRWVRVDSQHISSEKILGEDHNCFELACVKS